jgi:hypothetical protein
MGRYVAEQLLYWRSGALLALPFDSARGAVVSKIPVTIAEGVVPPPDSGGSSQYAASTNGSLAYVPAAPHADDRRLVSLDRSGRVEAVPAPLKPYKSLDISPDGATVALYLGSDAHDVRRPLVAVPVITPYGAPRARLVVFIHDTEGGTTFEARELAIVVRCLYLDGIVTPDHRWLKPQTQ